MTGRLDVAKLPPLAEAAIAQQPDAVWRAVERECLNGWGGKVRQMLKLDGMVDGHMPVIETGWLTWESMPRMEAWGVPVRQWFTVCALRQREPPA